jgi:hypothetical protein
MKPVTNQLEMKKSSSESRVLVEHRIHYALPSTGNILTSSQLINHQPMLTSVNNSQRLQYRINSTTGFHDSHSSYLTGDMVFTLTKLGAGRAGSIGFGKGSVMNAIDRVMLKNAAGDIIIDERNVGQRKYFTNRYEKSEAFLNSVCGGMGYRTVSADAKEDVYSSTQHAFDTTGGTAVVEVSFLIPLTQLGGVFAQNKLLPPYLTSGAILEIGFYPDATKFMTFDLNRQAADGVLLPAFTVQDNNMMLKTHMFNDSTMVAIKKEASRSLGIQMLYTGYEAYEDSSTGTTNYTYQITKSVSNATQVFAVEKIVTVLPAVFDISKEPYGSDPNPVVPIGLSYRLGSLNIPQAPFSNPSRDELLLHTQTAFEQAGIDERGGMVRRSDVDLLVHAASFKQTPSDVSGSAINLGRSLVINIKTAAAVAKNYQFFLKYQKLIRVFIDKSIVFE